jgi:hypothetical protein
MSPSELSPEEHQLLWMLVTHGGEVFQGTLNIPKVKPFRDGLERRGLVTVSWRKRQLPEEPAKRGLFLELTPAGWTWCNEQLHWPPPSRPKSKADMVLGWLLPRLKMLLDRGEAAANLADFINKSHPDAPPPEPAPAPPQPPMTGATLEERIGAACLELGGGKQAVRVRIADVRKRLPDVPHDTLTEAIVNLARQRRLTLYPLDDPRQVTDEDKAAAIVSSTGVPQHILYYGGIVS